MSENTNQVQNNIFLFAPMVETYAVKVVKPFRQYNPYRTVNYYECDFSAVAGRSRPTFDNSKLLNYIRTTILKL